MRSRWVLALWLLGILFPLVGLRHFSGIYRRAFDAVFGQEWVHIVMHVLLYAGLGFLWMVVLKLPYQRRTFVMLVVATLGVGVIQETLQWLAAGTQASLATMLQYSGFDLLVDLAGASLGVMTAWQSRKLSVLARGDENIR